MRHPEPPHQPSEELLAWFRVHLNGWFAVNGRSFSWRSINDEYRTVIAEALLQRTTAAAVEAFLPHFFRQFPTWDAIRQSQDDQLERELRPVGLWRRRAASLRQLARQMRDAHDLPTTNDELRALPGVGQYIANAVSLIVHGERRPLLDSNMARVLERFFGPRQLADIRYDPYLQELASRVVDVDDPKAINWAILDLAAATCRPTPRCDVCPLAGRCRTGGNARRALVRASGRMGVA